MSPRLVPSGWSTNRKLMPASLARAKRESHATITRIVEYGGRFGKLCGLHAALAELVEDALRGRWSGRSYGGYPTLTNRPVQCSFHCAILGVESDPGEFTEFILRLRTLATITKNVLTG
jgi:hypothetical protein